MMDPKAPIPSRPEERFSYRDANPSLRSVTSITGTGSNSGKTWLAARVIETLSRLGRTSTALKITRTHLDRCPRDNDACGTCDSVVGEWQIIDDPNRIAETGKDTARYVDAGANRVLWLLCRPAAMAEGIRQLLRRIPAGDDVVVEGNSFRDFCSADTTFMAVSAKGRPKPSAGAILDRVDVFVARDASALETARRSFDGVMDREWIVAADIADRVEMRLRSGMEKTRFSSRP